MTLHALITFLVVSGLVVAVPGPTVLLVMSYGLAHGKQTAWKMALGVGLGDLVAMGLAFMGVGTLLSVWPWAYWALKWAGAIYLVYLGLVFWRRSESVSKNPGLSDHRQARRSVVHVFWVTALNPQGIVFFTAFFPQFLIPHQPFLPQLWVLGSLFLVVSGINTVIYVYLAQAIRTRWRGARGVRWVNRISGGVLMLTGALTPFLK